MLSVIKENRKADCGVCDRVSLSLGEGRSAVATVLRGVDSTSLIISLVEDSQLELDLIGENEQ